MHAFSQFLALSIRFVTSLPLIVGFSWNHCLLDDAGLLLKQLLLQWMRLHYLLLSHLHVEVGWHVVEAWEVELVSIDCLLRVITLWGSMTWKSSSWRSVVDVILLRIAFLLLIIIILLHSYANASSHVVIHEVILIVLFFLLLDNRLLKEHVYFGRNLLFFFQISSSWEVSLVLYFADVNWDLVAVAIAVVSFENMLLITCQLF